MHETISSIRTCYIYHLWDSNNIPIVTPSESCCKAALPYTAIKKLCNSHAQCNYYQWINDCILPIAIPYFVLTTQLGQVCKSDWLYVSKSLCKDRCFFWLDVSVRGINKVILQWGTCFQVMSLTSICTHEETVRMLINVLLLMRRMLPRCGHGMGNHMCVLHWQVRWHAFQFMMQQLGIELDSLLSNLGLVLARMPNPTSAWYLKSFMSKL